MNTICGIDCSNCFKKESCKGCAATCGHPLGGNCVMVECCHSKGIESCNECDSKPCEKKLKVIEEVKALGIKDMSEITEMYELAGSVVNLAYPLPDGKEVKFWKDNDIYWGCQVHKLGTEHCYGIAADEKYLLVSEYGDNGCDPEIVVFKRR